MNSCQIRRCRAASEESERMKSAGGSPMARGRPRFVRDAITITLRILSSAPVNSSSAVGFLALPMF